MAVLATAICLLPADSPPAAARYWMEILDGRTFAVGESDGVTVAVALRGSTVIDVDVIAFNDTTSRFKIVARRIRPSAVRRVDATIRRVPLPRSEFRVRPDSVSFTPLSAADEAWSLSRTTAPVPPGFDPPAGRDAAQRVTGHRDGMVVRWGTATSSTRYAPVVVRPGGAGRKSIAFEKRAADWYEVEVWIAGEEFTFRFALPPERPGSPSATAPR